jgi:hypothetical protein
MLGNAVPKMSACLRPSPRGTYFGNASLLGHYPTPNSDPYICVTYIPKVQIKANRQGPRKVRVEVNISSFTPYVLCRYKWVNVG